MPPYTASIRNVGMQRGVHPDYSKLGKINFTALAKLIEESRAAQQGPSGLSSTYNVSSSHTTQSLIDNILKSDADEKDKSRRLRNLSPAVADQYEELLREKKKHVGEDAERHEGLFWRIMDNISRPLYGVAGAVGEIIDPDVSEASNPLGAFWKGVTLDERVTTADILEETGIENPWVRGIGGFVGDVLLDPLTYTGIGAVKSLGTSAARSGARAAGLATKNMKIGESVADQLVTGLQKVAPNTGTRKLTTVSGKTHTISQMSDDMLNDAFKINRLRTGQRLTKTDRAEITENVRRVADAAGGEASNARQLKGLNDLTDAVNEGIKKMDDAVLKADAARPAILEGFQDALGSAKVNNLIKGAQAGKIGALGVGKATLEKKVNFLLDIASPTAKRTKAQQKQLDQLLDSVGIDRRTIRKMSHDDPSINAVIGMLNDTKGLKLGKNAIRNLEHLTSSTQAPSRTLNQLSNAILEGDVNALKKLTGYRGKLDNVADFAIDPKKIPANKMPIANLARDLLDNRGLTAIRNFSGTSVGGVQGGLRGFKGAKNADQLIATRNVLDTLLPGAKELDNIANVWSPSLGLRIPGVRRQIGNLKIPGVWLQEGKIGANVTKAIDRLGQVPGLTNAAKMMTKAQHAWDTMFNTASRLDSSVGNIVSNNQSNLAQSRDAIARQLNEAFDGTKIVDREDITNVLRLDESGLKTNQLMHNPNGVMEELVQEEMLGVVGRLREVMKEARVSNLNHVYDSIQGSTPFKFRMDQRHWEKLFNGRRIDDMADEDIAEVMLKSWGSHARSRNVKNVDIAELIHWVDVGVHHMASRQGLIAAFKKLGLGKDIAVAGSKLDDVPSTATALMRDQLPNYRTLQASDFKLAGLDPQSQRMLKRYQDQMSGILFHEEVIPALTRALELSNPKQLGRLRETYAKTLGAWKRWATIYNIPFYHNRNTYSDTFMNHLNGLSPTQMFRPNSPYHKAAKVMYQTRQNGDMAKMYQNMLADTQGLRQTMKGVRDLSKERAMRNLGTAGEGSPILKLSKGMAANYGKSTLDSFDIMAMYRKYHLQSHFINEDIARDILTTSAKGKRLKDRFKNNAFNRRIIDWSGHRENYFRLGNFIHSLEDGMRQGIRNMDELGEFAADKVRKYNFDYNDFTALEQDLIRYIFPFYKWTRRAVPTLLTSMFTSPRVHSIWNSFNRNFQQSGIFGTSAQADPDAPNIPSWTETMPSWMLEAGLFPMSSYKGDEVMGGIPLPALDTLGFLTKSNIGENPTYGKNAAMGLLGMGQGLLNPFLALPLNLAGFQNTAKPGMPGLQDIGQPTYPNSPGWAVRAANAVPSTIGGVPSRLGGIMREYNYNQDKAPYEGAGDEFPFLTPTIISMLTGTSTQQNTEPRQLQAINELIDWYSVQNRNEDARRGWTTQEAWESSYTQPYLQEKNRTDIARFIENLLGGG